MEHNVILAGVGGQGILTIAQAISTVAMRRGWHVKQAEVHGMAQRGGAVQSHIRFADHELYSDLIPLGKADMILAVEPLEALRYVQFLHERGTIVTNTAPFINIPNYAPIEEVLDRITGFNHLLIDADRLARAAGSARVVNTVMFGAASTLLGLDLSELDASVEEMFGRKGARIVDLNQRACRFGRNAAAAYADGLNRGAGAREVRHWIETLPPDQLAEDEGFEEYAAELPVENHELSYAETHALFQTLEQVEKDERKHLYEHEVYRLIELVGAISPPAHLFLEAGEKMTREMLDRFPGEKVVLKIVSPEIVHKSDAGGVVFVNRNLDTVNRRVKQLIRNQQEKGARVVGVLVVEYVERSGSGFGQELFVGIRATREFGPIIAAGLGGIDTEYLAHKMKPGIAVAKALAEDTSAEEFLEMFKKTAGYEVLAGKARGHRRVVSDGALLRCFKAFLAVARRFCTDRGEEGPDLRELEVNPFAFARQRMIPLDGHGLLGSASKKTVDRPISKIDKLLMPRSIAVVGASAKRRNFGRIILENIIECRFPQDHLYAVKKGVTSIEGIPCVADLASVPEPIDLLVVATNSGQMPLIIEQAVDSGKVASMILIPGGAGETEGTKDIPVRIRKALDRARERPDGGPIAVGPNCLGIRSRPGYYDTFFVSGKKLDPRREEEPRRAALISQSGAFIISRMSNLEFLDPKLAVSLGNQIDLTVSDMLRAIGTRDDIDSIGVYVEGFNDMDGLAFVTAVEEVTAAGKLVIFYKAGRTAPGRRASAGHTASVAGDYDICQTAVGNAGAIVTDTFKEFEQLLELATELHDKKVHGRRIGIISNAGFETVGMADTILGARYQLEIPDLSPPCTERIANSLAGNGLANLINIRNPLDLTPMADEEAYEACARAMIEESEIDAVVISIIPLTPQLHTTADEIGHPASLTRRIPELLRSSSKPVIAVVDAGVLYEELAHSFRAGGVPVFRSSDQAVRSLGRYLCHRTAHDLPLTNKTSPAGELAGIS